MNIHEYQAKGLLEDFGVPIPKGIAIHHQEKIEETLRKFPTVPVVVKAQIHAGGRGKGKFKDGFEGGVHITSSKNEAAEVAVRMLGNTLVTHQTGPSGKIVGTIYFNEAIEIKKEYYIAVLLDRNTAQPVIIASTEGGVEIEKIAAETPEKIIRVMVDPALGLQAFQARQIAAGLGFHGDSFHQMVGITHSLYNLFFEKEASLVEINPLIANANGSLQALDAKISFDDNALYRHPEILEMRDLNEEDAKEVEASKFSLNYIALDGNIACMVNGAGLAMATMDIIKYYGGSPANFLDVGGSADEKQVEKAFRIILSDQSVKGILVNIFGGIIKCDVIAQGIIAAAKSVKISVPLVVRLEGTNVKQGKALLEKSSLQIVPADSLSSATRKIVKLVAV
ncbi:MAG: Succinate--CoA ligase [ADP-forming] subunit beta [Candidatus Moanabacter tarae]|uniref:Succinate--CoA ligase [ADP-forming] subunit beta n=1 Tax=Candidatus Moanibacter tarae TaxID=2200854 RepID=A0A2Z4ANI3_9BACT|nr:MAG: Succinate--CoA ligase [ADP-forming] subunit beta [Candidatus Moanabacter tarae]|tara:strand:- start:71611 stop:72795 length:1185 start_codon:yes stop_codon:yes gene_type:complete